MSDSGDGCKSDCCEIAIAGGGCSGVLVAAQLLRRGFSGRITIIEVRPRLGRGLAYSTPFDQHLLNVPAGNMSAFPDRPGHFVSWLREYGWPAAAADLFAPRRTYGEYLEATLQSEVRATSRGSLRRIQAEVVDVQSARGGMELTLGDGSRVKAGKTVLALGNPVSSSVDSVTIPRMGERWQVSPWMGDTLQVRFAGERILLLGTGLTAVDSALALLGQAQPCTLYLTSRRGLLPQVHDLRRSPASPPIFEEPHNLRLMFKQLRAQIRTLRDQNGCWRSAVDALRPVTNDIWRELPLADQKRFLRHLKTYWEMHRHRMAPQIRQQMDEYRAKGRVEVIAGRIRETSPQGEAVMVTIGKRSGGECRLEVDRMICCAGIQENYKAPRRLIGALMQRGLASANDLGIGLRTGGAGALIDARGNVSTQLFTLGPPRRGDLFETTAVPELRVQAEELAQHLIRHEARAGTK